MLSRTALGGIWVYQQYISPRKGFRCAHAVLHDGTGCSGYAKQAIKQHGLFQAIPSIRQRFRDCRAAYHILRSEQNSPSEKRKKKKSDSCARQIRDEFCGTVVFEGCGGCWSGAGRSAPSASKGCDLDCDICSCG